MQLSVIMTTYNRPGALRRVLEGLAGQTRLPDEVIIADDGSGPETTAVIASFEQAGPFALEHVRHADRGFRAAAIRNKAINRSHGDYLVCLDGDCIPDSHFIADHLKLAQRGCFFQGKRVLIAKQRAAIFSFQEIATPLRKLKCLLQSDIGNRHHLLRLPFFPAFKSRRLSGIRSCNMGFFRDDIYAVNGFNEDFEGWGREDSELAVRLFNYGLKRKSHAFAAICFHLWHAENDRDRLAVNDALLAQMRAAETYFCTWGLSGK